MFFKYSEPLNFSYLVCISCKIFIRWRFYLFLKTENSRRVAESRPICVGFNKEASFWQHVRQPKVLRDDIQQWTL
jgi:hypothetical protein